MFTASVECLQNGAPHAAEARALVDYFFQLPPESHFSFARVVTTLYLTHRVEELRLDPSFTIAQYQSILTDSLQFAKNMVLMQSLAHKRGAKGPGEITEEFTKITQNHYGNLFQSFSAYHYYEEPKELLKTRFSRNEVYFADITSQQALDAGCGGGRYTLALASLGFKSVVGVDFSPQNIRTAQERAAAKQISNVRYQEGNVLDLPFEDSSFDFVFSNGVLHHTPSIADGVSEMVRVLKPGGQGWLFVIAKPGGIEWDTVEILRQVMRPVPHSFAQQALLLAGIPQNRIFYILDHIMVPINTLSASADLEGLFGKLGISSFRRLNRGTDFDGTEIVYQRRQNAPEDQEIEWKYGVGEHRYIFKK